MKKSLLFLSLTLTLASAPVVFAQEAGNTNASSAPTASGSDGQKAGKWKAVFEQLGLTEAQKGQIRQIRANTQPGPDRRKQIMAVLTPDQKQKLISLLKDYQAGQ